MFSTHQKRIGAFARDNHENMQQVIQFVYLTIQQPLEIVPAAMNDVNEKGYHSSYLWGWKREAFAHIDEHSERIYAQAMDLYSGYTCPEVQERELLKYFAALPGLGLIKGGFVVQLCFGLSGCIDRHNLARFNIPESRLSAHRLKRARSEKTRTKIAKEYQGYIVACGGSESLWNGWCEYVASKRPERYASGFEVSQLHCDAIGA